MFITVILLKSLVHQFPIIINNDENHIYQVDSISSPVSDSLFLLNYHHFCMFDMIF